MVYLNGRTLNIEMDALGPLRLITDILYSPIVAQMRAVSMAQGSLLAGHSFQGRGAIGLHLVAAEILVVQILQPLPHILRGSLFHWIGQNFGCEEYIFVDVDWAIRA